MITGKINVSKITKSKLYDGKHGKMLSFILIDTPESKYGDDYMIVENTTKEERERGIKGVILGNAKILASNHNTTQTHETQIATKKEIQNELPF